MKVPDTTPIKAAALKAATIIDQGCARALDAGESAASRLAPVAQRGKSRLGGALVRLGERLK